MRVVDLPMTPIMYASPANTSMALRRDKHSACSFDWREDETHIVFATMDHQPRQTSNALFQILALLLAIVSVNQVSAADVDKKTLFYLAPSFRSEGKILLKYEHKDNVIEHHLVFSEVSDAIGKRSKVRIGYMSYEPNEYYIRDGTILKVNDLGRCELMGKNDKSSSEIKIIPELDWFVKMSYTNEELMKYFAKHKFESGPSILLRMPLVIGSPQLTFERVATHRNMECRVSSAKYSREKATDIKLEIFDPPIDMGEQIVPFFSVRESVLNSNDGNGGSFQVSFTLDYYSTEQINANDMNELVALEEEFSLPFGAGCSGFLPKIEWPQRYPQSFTIGFQQLKSQSFISVAYDHEKGLLRRDMYRGGGVSIWDLNENLLYSVDNHGSVSMMIDMRDSTMVSNDPLSGRPRVSTEACSVLRVDDKSLGPAQRPETDPNRMYVLRYLGANTGLVYIGRSTVRGLPCSVYETILDEPPAVFALNTDTKERTEGKYDYIVEFYLLTSGTILESYKKIGNDFWPARINLIKRHKKSGQTQNVYDSLEVADFHWGLFGLPQKPSELFMAPECFDIEEEQVKIELLLEFRRNGVKFPLSSVDMSQLRENKFLIEQQLLNNLFAQLFKISRLHLTQFELTLRPHDALVYMVISDRIYDKRLMYFGQGELPEDKYSVGNRLVLIGGALDEESCVLMGSHMTDISVVAYCPRVANVREEARCIAVFKGSSPVVRQSKKTEQDDGAFVETSTSCHMYRFAGAQPPESGTQDWPSWRESLRDFGFTIQLEPSSDGNTGGGGGPRVTYSVKVLSFDLEKKMPLLVVDYYKYSMEDGRKDENMIEQSTSDGGEKDIASRRQRRPPKVRSFYTMNYNTVGDCARMCNLDVSCKSYSYCYNTKGKSNGSEDVPDNERCLLSSLDIRASAVNEQLLNVKLENTTATVQDYYMDGTGKYNLRLSYGCKIHEKDYLDSYTETGEVLALPAEEAKHYLQSDSASKCAALALDVEGQQEHVNSHTIAYCPDTLVCLIDSNLFTKGDNSSQQEDQGDDVPAVSNGEDSKLESSCLVYRRKYQTFFHVSARVLKQARVGDDEEEARDMVTEFSQLPIELATVEECARACWIQFGQVCASFDYCSAESLCLINSIALDEPLEMKTEKKQMSGEESRKRAKEKRDRLLETRAGCLHYERDLRIDQLRRSHAALRHQTLDLTLATKSNSNYTASGWPFSGFLSKSIIFCALSLSFLVGLVIGKRVSDKLEQHRPGSIGIANFINSLAGSGRAHGDRGALVDSSQDLDTRSPRDDETGSIQLEEFKHRDAGADELGCEGKNVDFPDSSTHLT